MGTLVHDMLTKLFKNYLLVTNISVSVAISATGDIIQQKYEQHHTISIQENSDNEMRFLTIRNWNYLRTGHMSLSFGLTSGIMCHFWYNYLDRLHPGRGLKTIAKKVLTDQVLFSPVCIAACLLMSAKLKGADFKQKSTWRGACHKGLQLYIAEWLLWPPAQFVNFYFLHTRYRVLYDNLVSLVFDVYASHVQHHDSYSGDKTSRPSGV